jgi:hypothetical protein
MKKSLALAAVLAICSTVLAVPASATTLSVTYEVWDTDVVINIEDGEPVPSASSIKRSLLWKCRNSLSIRVGTQIRAVNQNGATAGLGRLNTVSIGKVTRGTQDFYANFDEDEPTFTEVAFVAPCVFKGTVANLRKADFYRFTIGKGTTEEFDSSDLRRDKWRLSLLSANLFCPNYKGFERLRGCDGS